MIIKNILFTLFKRVCISLSGSHIGSFPPAAKLYHFLMDHLHPDKIMLDGNILYLDPHDSLAVSVFPQYERMEMSIMKEYVKKGMYVIELGSYIGDQTVTLGKLVGSIGKVFAFEPNPSHAKLLEKNIKANKLANIVIVKKAVADKNGTIYMYLNPQNLADHRIYPSKGWAKIEIPVITLDEYFKKNKHSIDFLKMDIQGAEGEALLGMKKILSQNPHIKILSEFWPQGLEQSRIKPKEYLEMLRKLKFTLFFLDEKHQKIIKASNDMILKACYTDPLKTYVNIFGQR